MFTIALIWEDQGASAASASSKQKGLGEFAFARGQSKGRKRPTRAARKQCGRRIDYQSNFRISVMYDTQPPASA